MTSEARNPPDTNLLKLRDQENKELRQKLEKLSKCYAKKEKALETLQVENAALKARSPRKWN
jgi:hypothetical protein